MTEAWIEFETEVGRGQGHLRLKDGEAWTLLTTLIELKGHEEDAGTDRPQGVEHGADPDRETWLGAARARGRRARLQTQPEVVIVGGGQGGIVLGARLRQLGVPTIIVERNERPGDSWRKRYKSLCLHDPVWYDHLPYIKFPDNWPVFSPKDKIARLARDVHAVMELNYWGSTEAKSARYDDEAGEWIVVVERGGRGRDAAAQAARDGHRHVRQAERAQHPGPDAFRGDSTTPASTPGPTPTSGKKAVVIGSNNSAHDICAALWENGADVTMVQRSSTHIVALGHADGHRARGALLRAGSRGGVTTEKADLIFASLPYRIMHEFQIPLYDADARARRRLLRAAREGRLRCSISARTARVSS